MKQREKIKKKTLDKNHRREKITLDGRFGQKRRIERKKSDDIGIYRLVIYGKHTKTSQTFYNMGELLGIVKGLTLGFFTFGQ